MRLPKVTIKSGVGKVSGSESCQPRRDTHAGTPLVCLIEPNLLLRPLLLNKFRNKQKMHICLPKSRALAGGQLCPDIFVLDRGTLGGRFHFHLSQIATQFPHARIAVLDGPLEPAEQSLLIKIGVHGFLPYSSLDKNFASLVTALMSGKLWFKPSVLAHHIQACAAKSLRSANGAGLGLTGRQQEILSFIKQGFSNKEISAQLVISESTVKFHLAKMFDKFGVHNKRSLVPYFEMCRS